MSRLVAEAPSDFVERHLALSRDLDIESLTLTPGTLKRQGERAELPFQGVRGIKDLGSWAFASTLRLALRDGRWKVLWTPETLHPALKDGGRLRFREVPAPGIELVTRSGVRFPHDSGAEDYLGGLNADVGTTESGYVLEAVAADGRIEKLVTFPPPNAKKVKTTFSRPIQAAAARALDGVDRPAAIVAIQADTGQVLAVADRLGGEGAFRGYYPPGSTFKVITAAALLSAGLSADSPVRCPATYTPPNGQPIQNAGGDAAPGTITLAGAFAVSCNTTFVEQSILRLSDGGLVKAAELFGFNQGHQGPGGLRQDRTPRRRRRPPLRRHRPELGGGQPALHGPGRGGRTERILAPAVHDGTSRGAGGHGRPAARGGRRPAHDDAGGRVERHRLLRGPSRRYGGQDGNRRGGRAGDARLVHRLPGKAGLRRLREERRKRRAGGRPHRGALPASALAKRIRQITTYGDVTYGTVGL